jgi:hypothetical protein
MQWLCIKKALKRVILRGVIADVCPMECHAFGEILDSVPIDGIISTL